MTLTVIMREHYFVHAKPGSISEAVDSQLRPCLPVVTLWFCVPEAQSEGSLSLYKPCGKKHSTQSTVTEMLYVE